MARSHSRIMASPGHRRNVLDRITLTLAGLEAAERAISLADVLG